MNIPDIPRRIVSTGGVGSSKILSHVENKDPDRVLRHEDRKHTIHPRFLVQSSTTQYRFLFMTGDPFNAVLSVWRRDLHQVHEVAMSFGKFWFDSPDEFTDRRITEDLKLEDYLDAGHDAFHIAEHVDNWISYDTPPHVKILIVRYEHLADYISDVMKFLQCKRPFAVRPRKSDWTKAPKAVQDGLVKTYGAVRDKINALPPLMRR